MKFIILACALSLGLMHSFSTTAQDRNVIGKVTLFNTFGINNVSIVVGSSKFETFTDSLGYYAVNCNEDDKLSFSAHGFFNEKINLKKVNQSDSVNVSLKLKKGEKNVSYATGYGHIDEKSLTYAIQHFDGGEDYSSYRTILDAIEGRVAGATVVNGGVIIRGGTNSMEGDTPALLVVDGTIVSYSVFQNIPPGQVKTIDVLKGAAVSARYGSQGSGGVIVVVTKSEN